LKPWKGRVLPHERRKKGARKDGHQNVMKGEKYDIFIYPHFWRGFSVANLKWWAIKTHEISGNTGNTISIKNCPRHKTFNLLRG